MFATNALKSETRGIHTHTHTNTHTHTCTHTHTHTHMYMSLYIRYFDHIYCTYIFTAHTMQVSYTCIPMHINAYI